MEGGYPVFRPGTGFRELNHIPNVEPPMFHHSLIAELGVKILRFRELVVFHSEQVCPRYLIAYQRLAPGKAAPQWNGVQERRR